MRATALIFVSAVLAVAVPASGQQTPPEQPASTPTPTSPSALSTPSITGPLQLAPPITFDAGPFGGLSLDGILSGFGVVQSNHAAGDSTGDASLSNCQVFVQKPDGSWQFYVQAGAYNILSLGLPFVSTGKQVDELYGPVPVAYLKLVAGKNTSLLVGALPTLMGAEYTFDFENMNIERGLLWNQENAINRGIQLNQAIGKLAGSFSWNDGYYSNRYSWLSGSLTYARGPHALTSTGGWLAFPGTQQGVWTIQINCTGHPSFGQTAPAPQVMIVGGNSSGPSAHVPVSGGWNRGGSREAVRGAGEGGQTYMPLQETFFAPRFSQLRDQFGVRWTLMAPPVTEPGMGTSPEKRIAHCLLGLVR